MCVCVWGGVSIGSVFVKITQLEVFSLLPVWQHFRLASSLAHDILPPTNSARM